MAKTKPKRTKKPPRIEARFDALTFTDSRHIITKGAFFAAQTHPAKWSLSVTAAVLTSTTGLIDKRFLGLYSNEEPVLLNDLIRKITPEILSLFQDEELVQHVWIHAIKH